MTAKQKATKLFQLYYRGKDTHGTHLCQFRSGAIKCGMITVDEILNHIQDSNKFLANYTSSSLSLESKFWEDVKIELEKLSEGLKTELEKL